MARIYSNEGLIQNQNNSNSFIRIYSCGKNDSGPYYQFNILTSNPAIYINMIHYYSFTTGGSHASYTNISGIYFDTSGNGSNFFGGTQSVAGANGYFVEYTFPTSRQAIVTVGSTSSGLSNAKGSIISHIFCNRWDFVTITQL
jgi:hypothetical protein